MVGRVRQAVQDFSKFVSHHSKDTSAVDSRTSEKTYQILHPENPEVNTAEPVHLTPDKESPSLAKRIKTLWEGLYYYRVPTRLVDNRVVTAVSRKIDQVFKSEPKNLIELKVEVEKLREKYVDAKDPKTGMPKYFTPKEKEDKELLRVLSEKIQTRPTELNEEWERAKADPESKALISSMGVVRFLAMKAKIEENKSQAKGSSAMLLTSQEIALMGYTTGDYREINNAMRRRKGETDEIQHPGIKSYAQTLSEGIESLPDLPMPEEGKLALKRGINIPRGAPANWAENLFKKGQFFVDPSFTSTTYGDAPNATILVTYLPPVGANSFPHAKQIQDSYSIWPGEKEAIIEPNTPFLVEEFRQDGDKYYVTLRSVDQEVSPASRRRANYWLQQLDS